MTGISKNANSKLPEFSESITATSKSLCGLTEAAAQAAYLGGISDPNSQVGQQGLVDPTQFTRANQAIQMACQNLMDPACTPSQCQFIQSAKEVANGTTNLVKTIKGSRAMEPIVSSAKTMLESSAGLIQTARSLPVNPKDPPQWSVLAIYSRTVSDSIKKLITNMREKTPGQWECDEAIEVLNAGGGLGLPHCHQLATGPLRRYLPGGFAQ
ncbi:hypothetical protein AV530_007019 [Patagioenas fasciata monilis]|uniref:Talin IBS2B domain-containing protein n=1 Tax=Patagioenas fasciata monilis TaxID=372326 RepID=A0A1V4KZS9_PATFA|nr:hypothetical protein AV530_007019 [Patagioenas fasciata monilis]